MGWIWLLIGLAVGCVATYTWFIIKLLNCKIKVNTPSASHNIPMQAKAQIDEQLCAIEKIVGDAPLYSCELLFHIKNVRQLLHG